MGDHGNHGDGGNPRGKFNPAVMELLGRKDADLDDMVPSRNLRDRNERAFALSGFSLKVH